MSTSFSNRPVFRKDELATLASGGNTPALRLCSLCEGIPVNTLTLQDGYDHYQSIKLLRASAGCLEYCHLCQMMWESIATSTRFNMEGDPMLLDDWPIRLYAIQADADWSWRGYSAIELRSGDRSKSADDTWHTAPTWSSPGVPGTIYPVVSRLYLHEGDDVSPITYSTAALDETSDTSAQQRQWWFHTCQSVHQHPLLDQAALLPTRVIDVDVALPRPKLQVQSKPPTIASNYAALSYCWGKTKAATTTVDNLNRHISRGFEFSSLPKTIQDAIIVTRELGIRYLWVDALCILQGSDVEARDDWDVEASKMSSVYGNATVTIIAANSSDCGEGIFRQRSIKDLVSTPKLTTDLGLPGQYNVRGWTLQEMVLSTRALFFTQSMQYWKCPCGVIGEDGKQSKFTTVKSLTKEHVQQDWHAVVQEYSRRKLTNDKDKFPALSGLAKTYDEGQSGQYYAGLWQATLIRDLLWRTELSETPMPPVTTWRAPSWSWASTNEAIDFDLAKGDIGDDDYKAAIQADVAVASVDPFGRLKHAQLTVHGKVEDVRRLLVNAYHTAGDAVVGGLTVRAYVDSKKKWTDAETITNPCQLLLLTRSRGLVITRAGKGSDLFKRIGVFMVAPRYRSYDLDSWRQDTVTLV